MKDNVVGVYHESFRLPNKHLPMPHVNRVFSSGICLDPRCSVVVAPYHTQMFVGKAMLSVEGAKTEKILSVGNVGDSGKVGITVMDKTAFYNPSHDISFVYTKKPVPHKLGVPYSYKANAGQPVQVVGYFKSKYTVLNANIIGSTVPIIFNGARMEEGLVLDVKLERGYSGFAVLDMRGNFLGMIISTGEIQLGSGNIPASLALPTAVIARALFKLDPTLGHTLFTEPLAVPTPPTSISFNEDADDLPGDTSQIIPELTATPSDVENPVGRLRARAADTVKQLTNLIAKQCMVRGRGKPLCHELLIVGDEQTFRQIDKGGKLGSRTNKFSPLKYGVWAQSDWMDALGEIADNDWVFQGTVGDKYLFTFKAVAADDRCYWDEYQNQGAAPLFGGKQGEWHGSVDCFEQVLADREFNIIAVFNEMLPPEFCLTQTVQSTIYYDWVKLENIQAPVLLPTKERIAIKVIKQKNLQYTDVEWTEYRKFRVDSRLKF